MESGLGSSSRRTVIRAAVPADALGIARVHVESWKTTYAGIFPQALLDGLSIEDRASRWNDVLTNPPARFLTLVGCDETGQVVGFAAGGAERTGRLGCDGELHAIYLLPGVQRQGLGTHLMRGFARELRSMGFQSMVVWVLARNPSRKFYEALGATVITEQEIERGGEAYIETAYGWSDLKQLWPELQANTPSVGWLPSTPI